ncbi:MAG: tetratricopeptide repeat protein, partial [Candidatus Cloacimonetes bacterium]|nr:tetratricopeptide repeat protein [Candidatus Cloacimonadota bacterium]
KLSDLNKHFKRKFKEEFCYHGGMGFGECQLNIVGDKKYHYDFFMSGKSLISAYEQTEKAKENEIVIPDFFDAYHPEENNLSFPPLNGDYTGESYVPVEIRKKLSTGDFKAELRQTAVLFLNLKCREYTNIPLDIYHKAYTIIQEIVYQLHGIINKIDFNDKGYLVLITFGTITVSPDDIERAFICAYRLRTNLHGLLNIKIGLTRDSIYSGILGSKEHYEFGIIGNSVNVAARLLSGIGYGGIAFTEEILLKIKDKFEAEFVLETTVKGIAKPIKIYSFLREIGEFQKLYESSFNNMIPIAYQNEIDEINNSIMSQDGRRYLFAGESGTGKSFIAFTILKSAKLHDDQTCLISTDEFNKDNHLEVIRKLLKNYFATDDIIRDINLLTEYCINHAIPVQRDDLREFLDSGLTREFLFEDELATKNRILGQTLTLICSNLLKNKKLLILDDCQWCDKTSLSILLKVIDILSEQGTVSILTTETSSPISLTGAKEIHFDNLNEQLSAKLIKTVLKNTTPDADNFIYSLSSGNPLFIIELCRTLANTITDEFDLITGQRVKQFMLSGSVSDKMASIFMNEYDNLSPEKQQFLKLASIIGKAFSLDEIEQIANFESSGKIKSTIENLQTEGLISKVDLNPTMLFIFSNKLMRETIYSSILKSEKMHLHEKLGSYYEKELIEQGKSNYELVAIHYILAENTPKAIEYSVLAGDKSLRCTNLAIALHYYETALNLETDDILKTDLLLTVIDILLRMSETDKAEKLLLTIDTTTLLGKDKSLKYQYLKSRLFLLKCEYDKLTEEPVEPDIDELYSIRIALYKLDAYRFVGDYEQFDQLANELVTLFSNTGRKDYLGEILAILGQTMINRGKYSTAEQYYSEKLTIALERDDYYSMRIAYSSLGIIQSRQGNKVKAREFYLHALNAADKSGDKNGYAKVMMDLGTLSKNENNLKEAEVFYQKSIVTARAIGNRQQVSLVLYNLGEMHFWQNEYEKALQYFLESKQIAETLNDVVSISYCDDGIGDCYYRLEKFELAEETYLHNQELQIRINDREGLAHTWGNLGNIAKSRLNFPLAIDFYRKQQELLNEIGDIDGEGRAFFNWALVHIDKNEIAEAVVKFRKAYDLFLKCGAVQFADIALEQLNKYIQ